MATIYTTKAVYTAVSSQTIYSFGFDYLNKTFVKVKLGGQDLTYLQDYTVDEKTINLTNPPTQGVDLEIYRATSTEQEVQWEDSSVFRANTLNLFQTQLLHISQEALDGIRKASLKQDEVTSKWDAEGIQINNVGDPQESQDAVNLRYLSNLQDGYITQVEVLIANAKNVAEADHLDYLNRFMALLANAQGQANRAESEATRAYNEANRAKGYANTAHDNEILVESYKNTVETLKNETKSTADSALQSLASVRAIEAEMQETLTAEQVNAESVSQEATQARTALTNATTTLDTRYAGAEQFVTEARQIRSEVAVDKSDTLSYKNTATEQAQLAKQYADLAEQISSGGLDYITDTEAHDTFVTKTGTGASGTWAINITGNANTATKATNDGNGANITDTYLKKSGDTVTGTLNVPTQDATDNSTKVANTAFVQSAVYQLVNSAPETLDTLNELSSALGNDPNFATTVANMIGQKEDKTSVDNKISLHNTDLSSHEDIRLMIGQKADNDTLTSYVPLAGATMTGKLTVPELKATNGFIPNTDTTSVNTASGGSALVMKKASSTDAPNNGVVLEYGNSTSWAGQLYMGDNATQGLHWNGWSDGVRGSWKKIYMEGSTNDIKFANGTVLTIE